MRHRLRKPAAQKRQILLATRFNKENDAAVRAAAAACSMTPAGFLAHAAVQAARDLERTAAAVAGEREVISELFAVPQHLGRIGNNLNQVAKALNSGAEAPHADTVLAAVLRAATRAEAAADAFPDQQL